jgi:alpha-mannosidase
MGTFRPACLIAAAILFLPAADACHAAETVWKIGEPDGRRDDLALGAATDYAGFSKRFKDEIAFEVGRSKPAEDFPFVLPGPADVWAGSKSHTLKVRFDLPAAPAADAAYLFTLRLCLTHYEMPPVLEISAGGAARIKVETPKDVRGFVKAWKLPPATLRAGANEISIRNLGGSWAELDSLKLEAFPGGDLPDLISALRLTDSVRMIEDPRDGKLRQIVRATVEGIWDGRGTFRARSAAGEFTIDAAAARAPFGAYEVPVGEIAGPTDVECELTTASGAKARALVAVRPHRRWRIFAIMKTHYDLGYTHPIEEMLATAAGSMLDRILAFCDESRSNPPGARFVWNYPSWLIGKIRELSTEERRRRFDEAIRRGDISWSGLPFTLHSYFCGLEDIIRSVYPSATLDREFGTTVRWAKQTDVPGHTRIFPQVLARSGIRLLQIGANNGVRGVRMPLLFWWESPDGSRVLTQLTASYGYGYDEGMLMALEGDPAYPADAFLAVFITGDNVGPGDLNRVPALARDLAARYAYPKLRIGNPEGFVDRVAETCADRLPIVKTELNDWWIHGVASMARETAVARAAREELTAAEKASAIALLLDPTFAYPAGDFRKAYEESLLYSEHTWGMAGFKPKPQPPEKRDLETNGSDDYKKMRHSWEVKGDHARAAAEISGRTLAGALGAVLRAAKAPPGSIAVFNSLNWPRSDIVRVARDRLPAGPFVLKDLAARTAVPWQPDGAEVAFIARDVPPCGWALFRADPGGADPEVVTSSVARDDVAIAGEVRLNASGFSIGIDPKTGAAVSVKKDGEEIVDRQAPFGLGQFIYEGAGKIGDAGWHGSPYDGPPTGRRVPAARRWLREEGPVFSRFTAEGALEIDFPVEVGSVPRVVQTFTVGRDLGHVECETRLFGKRPSALSEMGHVAFPFRVPGGKFRVELLGSVVDPEKDIGEAGNRDAFAVQHWIDVSNGARGVTWCPVETTIASLGDIRLFRWDAAYVPEKTYIYSNAFNNGWSTNFQEWQGGDFRFRHRFRPHRGDFAEGDAPRFGWDTAQPLVAAFAPEGPGAGSGFKASPRASFVLAEAKTVVLLNLKRAEDGRGLIARLHENCGKGDVVRLSFPGRPIRSAVRTSLTEVDFDRSLSAYGVKEGAIEVPVGAWAIGTVRVEF